MLFNSFEFALFLPVVFLLYWFVFHKNIRLQNIFVVSVSYLFYGWWDWRFLILIFITTACSYASGILIKKSRERSSVEKKNAKIIAASNVVLNLAILVAFKYFNFFSENLNRLTLLFGYELDWVTLDILLPVGISFYTFQAISYTIDVYKNKIEATNDPAAFFAFVSFFPQLVAGPIERSTALLPQFYVRRLFNYENAALGIKQILWGFFKKIVVADNCATLTNQIFSDFGSMDGTTLFVGVVLFTFQIYGDFSGYSDIAIGTSRLFGINLMRNFNFPYLSRNVGEYWRRWHISLTTWFRDYIYIPLGGSRGSKFETVRNTMTIFLVSGLWHGANWTFIVWGAYHGLLTLPSVISRKGNKYKDIVADGRWLPNMKETLQMVSTFLLIVVGFIIFRSDNLANAWEFFRNIVAAQSYYPDFLLRSNTQLSSLIISLLAIAILMAGDWIASRKKDDFYICPNMATTIVLLLIVIFFGSFKNQLSFIYFQF